MKSKLLIMAMLSCALTTSAQEVLHTPVAVQPDAEFTAEPMAVEPAITDSLALPALTERGTISNYTLWGPFGLWNDWRLHSGLNASLSLSATLGIGNHSGSGFAQNVSLMYAAALTPRLSLAVGGYYSHFNWGPGEFNDAGLTAVLGYRFNEHWEAYLYGQKSIMTPKMPVLPYYMDNFGDKIGAEVRYNFSPSFSIGVSVWHERMPDQHRFIPMPRTSDADY